MCLGKSGDPAIIGNQQAPLFDGSSDQQPVGRIPVEISIRLICFDSGFMSQRKGFDAWSAEEHAQPIIERTIGLKPPNAAIGRFPKRSLRSTRLNHRQASSPRSTLLLLATGDYCRSLAIAQYAYRAEAAQSPVDFSPGFAIEWTIRLRNGFGQVNALLNLHRSGHHPEKAAHPPLRFHKLAQGERHGLGLVARCKTPQQLRSAQPRPAG